MLILTVTFACLLHIHEAFGVPSLWVSKEQVQGPTKQHQNHCSLKGARPGLWGAKFVGCKRTSSGAYKTRPKSCRILEGASPRSMPRNLRGFQVPSLLHKHKEHTYRHKYVWICMYVCMHACKYVCMYVSMCVYVCLYVSMYLLYVCMHARTHACMNVYSHTCTEKATEF